jgi:hypothetical protein
MDMEIDSRTGVESTVRVVRQVSLGELADRAAEARAERSGVRFNSSI